MKLKGMDMPGDYDVMYEYDPDTDGETYDDYDETENPEPEAIKTKDDLSVCISQLVCQSMYLSRSGLYIQWICD